MSCSGQLPFMKQAFKMACLAYQPSKVVYDEEPFNRLELLHKRAKMLEKQKGFIKKDRHLETFREDSKIEFDVSPSKTRKYRQFSTNVDLKSVRRSINAFTKTLENVDIDIKPKHHILADMSGETSVVQPSRDI